MGELERRVFAAKNFIEQFFARGRDPSRSVIGREMSAGCGRIWQVELLNSLNWSGVCYRGIGCIYVADMLRMPKNQRFSIARRVLSSQQPSARVPDAQSLR